MVPMAPCLTIPIVGQVSILTLAIPTQLLVVGELTQCPIPERLLARAEFPGMACCRLPRPCRSFQVEMVWACPWAVSGPKANALRRPAPGRLIGQTLALREAPLPTSLMIHGKVRSTARGIAADIARRLSRAHSIPIRVVPARLIRWRPTMTDTIRFTGIDSAA